MSLETLKQKIVATVDASEDEVLLQGVLEILSDNSVDKNETYYRNRLEESIRQADAGKVFPAKSVQQAARQRFFACTKSLNEA